jgi:hypothetical protein
MRTARRYETVRESRGWYYVEYRPPTGGNKFAGLNLIITEDRAKDEIVGAMEAELKLWLRRYPVPIYATAWDDKEDIYDFSGLKPNNHLIGFFDSDKTLRLHWESVKPEAIPDTALDQEYTDNLYFDLDFKTYAELEAESQKTIKGIKRGHFLMVIWFVVIPITVLILEFSSNLLSAVIFLYSVSKGLETWLELRGKLPKSKRDKEKEEEERLKNHYYYHCQMNPDGFNRLKKENFEKMAKEQIAKEAESLKRNKKLD